MFCFFLKKKVVYLSPHFQVHTYILFPPLSRLCCTCPFNRHVCFRLQASQQCLFFSDQEQNNLEKLPGEECVLRFINNQCVHCLRSSFYFFSFLFFSLITGDRPFKCDKCLKAFARKACLTRHKAVHAKDTPFNCKVS